MSEDKRSFFRRGAKKDDAVVDATVVQDEAVVENPTVAASASEAKEPTASIENSIAENVTKSPEPTPTEQPLVFTPRGMEKKSPPIEDKVQNLEDSKPAPKKDGWNNDMRSAPTDGSLVMVSETGEDRGVLAYWRISKYVDKANLRYVARGRWSDFNTKINVEFMPKYWKVYKAEEYYPLTKAPTKPEASK